MEGYVHQCHHQPNQKILFVLESYLAYDRNVSSQKVFIVKNCKSEEIHREHSCAYHLDFTSKVL